MICGLLRPALMGPSQSGTHLWDQRGKHRESRRQTRDLTLACRQWSAIQDTTRNELLRNPRYFNPQKTAGEVATAITCLKLSQTDSLHVQERLFDTLPCRPVPKKGVRKMSASSWLRVLKSDRSRTSRRRSRRSHRNVRLQVTPQVERQENGGAEAQEVLDQAIKNTEQFYWHHRLTLEQLRQESESLLGNKKKIPDPDSREPRPPPDSDPPAINNRP